MMYLSPLKTAMVTALRKVFNDNPNPVWRFNQAQNKPGVHVSIEFPIDKQRYPCIWVQYDDRDTLKIASIDHREYVVDDEGATHEVTRWEFEGTVTWTVAALTSRERDAIYDELVRLYAFARVERNQTKFRDLIENHPYLGVTLNWDELRPGGDGAGPAPWGTDQDWVYEKSLSFDIANGQFVSDPSTNTLVRLTKIELNTVSQSPGGESDPVSSHVDDQTPPSPWGQPI